MSLCQKDLCLGIYNSLRGGPNEVHVYDHCVKLVGWGEQEKSNKTGRQDKYFLAINSWSTKWAKDGTFKIDFDVLRNQRSDFYAGVPERTKNYSIRVN